MCVCLDLSLWLSKIDVMTISNTEGLLIIENRFCLYLLMYLCVVESLKMPLPTRFVFPEKCFRHVDMSLLFDIHVNDFFLKCFKHSCILYELFLIKKEKKKKWTCHIPFVNSTRRWLFAIFWYLPRRRWENAGCTLSNGARSLSTPEYTWEFVLPRSENKSSAHIRRQMWKLCDATTKGITREHLHRYVCIRTWNVQDKNSFEAKIESEILSQTIDN